MRVRFLSRWSPKNPYWCHKWKETIGWGAVASTWFSNIFTTCHYCFWIIVSKWRGVCCHQNSTQKPRIRQWQRDTTRCDWGWCCLLSGTTYWEICALSWLRQKVIMIAGAALLILDHLTAPNISVFFRRPSTAWWCWSWRWLIWDISLAGEANWCGKWLPQCPCFSKCQIIANGTGTRNDSRIIGRGCFILRRWRRWVCLRDRLVPAFVLRGRTWVPRCCPPRWSFRCECGSRRVGSSGSSLCVFCAYYSEMITNLEESVISPTIH